MIYKLMNDYSAGWPFWGGRDIGLCADDDPILPAELAAECRRWAAQFNQDFDVEHGWPTARIAAEHEAWGGRLYDAVRRALPDDEVTFHYWERAHRAD
ncbi:MULTISPECIES: hypothetical protein [unclassified Microbacterium]|uniref:hypothetical protein n=1 Tax=unclassified Microbacterium TaxID=2609290 RepID=UPI00301AB4D7